MDAVLNVPQAIAVAVLVGGFFGFVQIVVGALLAFLRRRRGE